MLLNQFFWLRILCDGDSGGAGGGTGDPTNPGQQDGNGAGGDKKSFSQAELDVMFSDRAKQAKQSALAEVLKELGVEDLEAVKTTIKTAKEAADAQLSELQKAQKDAADAAKAKADAEAKAQTATELANTRLMKSEVMLEAAKAEHKFRPDALADVWAFIDRSKLKVKDDGTVEGVAEAVKEVAKTKPYMVGEAPRGDGKGTPSREKGKTKEPPATEGEQRSTINF